jgi:hypothetical protein
VTGYNGRGSVSDDHLCPAPQLAHGFSQRSPASEMALVCRGSMQESLNWRAGVLVGVSGLLSRLLELSMAHEMGLPQCLPPVLL